MTASQGGKKVGIIGGGDIGGELLQILSRGDDIEVIFLVDEDPDAPALSQAQGMGIKTLTNLEMALNSMPVDYIFDATQSPDTPQRISLLNNQTPVVPGQAAFLMREIFKEQHGSTYKQVFADLSNVRKEIDSNTRDVSKTLHVIEKISNELEVLAINAGIQASRAGEFGKGFAVVAGEVKSTARVARNLAGDIDRVINEISSMSNKIEQSLKKAL
ncbi:MAG: hypothetical protein HQL52_18285 [Magnetococcales bacterium]|nr:hypothetical protein [Magnetococcales bacterium]